MGALVFIGNKPLDIASSILNSTINDDAFLRILIAKGIITEEEFWEMKADVIAEYQRLNPDIKIDFVKPDFKKSKKDNDVPKVPMP